MGQVEAAKTVAPAAARAVGVAGVMQDGDWAVVHPEALDWEVGH